MIRIVKIETILKAAVVTTTIHCRLKVEQWGCRLWMNSMWAVSWTWSGEVLCYRHTHLLIPSVLLQSHLHLLHLFVTPPSSFPIALSVSLRLQAERSSFSTKMYSPLFSILFHPCFLRRLFRSHSLTTIPAVWNMPPQLEKCKCIKWKIPNLCFLLSSQARNTEKYKCHAPSSHKHSNAYCIWSWNCFRMLVCYSQNKTQPPITFPIVKMLSNSVPFLFPV